LRQAQLTDVAGQGRLSDIEALGLEQLAQLLLARHRLRPDDLQDGRMALGLHGARIQPCTTRPATRVRRAVEGGGGRWRMVEGNTARSACFPTSNEPISRSNPSARAPSIVSIRNASSPSSAAAVASAKRLESPTLTTESVPRPTGRPARRKAASGAVPCPWTRLERGQ